MEIPTEAGQKSRTDFSSAKLIADHPALSNEIAFAVGTLAPACTVKLPRGDAAQKVFASAYAIGVAIPVDAASVGDGNQQYGLGLIAADWQGLRGAGRQCHDDRN
jgi:hypothetical protein